MCVLVTFLWKRTLCDACHREYAYHYHAFLDISLVGCIIVLTTEISLLSHSTTMKVCCFSLHHYKLEIIHNYQWHGIGKNDLTMTDKWGLPSLCKYVSFISLQKHMLLISMFSTYVLRRYWKLVSLKDKSQNNVTFSLFLWKNMPHLLKAPSS